MFYQGPRLRWYDERKAWPTEGLHGWPDQGQGQHGTCHETAETEVNSDSHIYSKDNTTTLI